MAFRRSWGMFQICLGLSVGWHLLGAMAIGTGAEPGLPVAQLSAPTLFLQEAVEVLPVGIDSLGNPIHRPVAVYHDPEYFGFPRTWAFGKFQQQSNPADHVAPVPEEIVIPMPMPSQDGEPAVPEEPVLDIPRTDVNLLELARDLEPKSDGEGLGISRYVRLVLRGPLTDRKCLVQVLPRFDVKTADQSRTLILGDKKSKRSQEGLVIRLWVSPEGLVRFVLLEGSSGEPSVDDMAVRAVRQWRFQEVADFAGGWQWGKVFLEEGMAP